MELIISWLRVSWQVLAINGDRIAWNTFLAVIPLMLSVWLFRCPDPQCQRWPRSPLWWVIFAVFIAFLPNAPYILTDIIHYFRLVRQGIPTSIMIFTATPQFLLFLNVGWQCYVMSLLNAGYYLQQRQWSAWILPMELTAHLLSAIGIYLGRFLRLNSWHVVTDPKDVGHNLAQSLSHQRPLLAISVTVVILTVFYWLTKQVNLGLVLRWQQVRRGAP
ncbi:DUF1361 domain-containing protein [Synechocystis sp. PCC 7339]|uniref:DUF1361 domain-containing protein n=1 Tax=unclassified Synechocystis TaxID=2640012 RepID=UPI001BB0332F|nr:MULTISPECIES: DUF1361 domain-containing protein [unclassified Synechocystis]QUS62054.1 DUF1361 domain-containing protein [Synechocystis sp. PCC 7338]UAJ74255.1 DUF1361 domain-containing protein [Synechocystis sp. PCC 7339]